ncbi:PREDICTED: uncharacterized protein LOC105617131 [Atta cephalotes]|uniref:Uncharacterized protein n=1 Tax=Atta cephalotes TaxID=12957 RepID=A0A158N986_ATTCE|nr:PREDICTED: uncharacterized protein LOC105617131 [Atta cephalotes]XP_018055966.1 PREDICTED: uncharacterized protein LOC108692285 [Atta colombica]
MRLLLILFFASTILARSARNRRDTDLTTFKLPVSTTEVYNGNKTTDVNSDETNENNIFNHPLRMILNLIKSIILVIKNTLLTFSKTINSASDFVIRAMQQPFKEILRMIIRIFEWLYNNIFN